MWVCGQVGGWGWLPIAGRLEEGQGERGGGAVDATHPFTISQEPENEQEHQQQKKKEKTEET
jgi:hypothetical protein